MNEIKWFLSGVMFGAILATVCYLVGKVLYNRRTVGEDIQRLDLCSDGVSKVETRIDGIQEGIGNCESAVSDSIEILESVRKQKSN